MAGDQQHFGLRGQLDVVGTQIDDHPRLAQNVLAALQQQKKAMAEQLASVRCKDYAEYLGRFMQIEGIDIAIHHVQEQAKKLG
jgi:hypothetical protein